MRACKPPPHETHPTPQRRSPTYTGKLRVVWDYLYDKIDSNTKSSRQYLERYEYVRMGPSQSPTNSSKVTEGGLRWHF